MPTDLDKFFYDSPIDASVEDTSNIITPTAGPVPAKYEDLFDYKRFPYISSNANNDGEGGVGDGRAGSGYRIAYGRKFPGNPDDLTIEMWCAARRLAVSQGGLGEFGHYKRILQLLYPFLNDEWHHWLDMQLAILTGPSGTYSLLGGGGIGKAAPLWSKIKVPGGWKEMGQMQIGDVVCTPNGSTAKIIGVHPQGTIPVFRVSFLDGSHTLCCGEHLWLTTTNEDRKSRNKLKARRFGSVKTTLDIAESLSCKAGRFEANHHIPVTKPVYGESVDVDINPYLLGMLISNGSMAQKSTEISVHGEDIDIVRRIQDIHPNSYAAPLMPKSNCWKIRTRSIKKDLEQVGLQGRKSYQTFIPPIYLHASIPQRLELFQGLNDGDGTPWVKGRGVEYSTSSQQLSEDYVELAQSLGCTATVKVKRAPTYTYKGEKRVGRPSYRIFVRVPEELEPFAGARKTARLQTKNRTALTRAIVDVEYVDDMPAQCITIDDEQQLYLTNDYIVTHNSFILGTLFARIWQACNPAKRGVMIINTTQKSQSERAWKYVIDACAQFPWLPGKLASLQTVPRLDIIETVVNPQNKSEVFARKKPGVGIISQTVKKGSSASATADLKGMHPDELMVIIEESNHLKRTHLERARANWITNKYYKIVLTGNPEIEDAHTGREDALYFFSTPVHGWDSITWGKDRIWDNKFGGKSAHFDPYDSPKIHEPGKFPISTWLPDLEYIEKKATELGGTNSQLFKQQIRGIYDHESLPFNPITMSMCKKFQVRRRANFTGMNRERWAAFDPAYSGNDEAFLKIAESGLTEEGRIEIDFLGEETNFSFKLDGANPQEPSFQMLDWVRDKLAAWGVPARNLVMDANIIGIGLGDIFSTYLSKEINKVIVTGKPGDGYMDLAEKVKARDRCLNRATELWIAFQQLVISGQIRGLDDSVIKQLIDMPAEIINGKIKLLDKREFRKRFGYSPDRAECCIFIVDLMRSRGLKHSIQNAGNGMGRGDAGRLGVQQGGFNSVRNAEDLFVNMSPRPSIHSESGSSFGRFNSMQHTQRRTPEDESIQELKEAYRNFLYPKKDYSIY